MTTTAINHVLAATTSIREAIGLAIDKGLTRDEMATFRLALGNVLKNLALEAVACDLSDDTRDALTTNTINASDRFFFITRDLNI